jgi:hypothetical protein
MAYSWMLRRVALVRRLLVTANVVPSSPTLVTLMIEALSSSETSVLTRATRRNTTEDAIIHRISFPARPQPLRYTGLDASNPRLPCTCKRVAPRCVGAVTEVLAASVASTSNDVQGNMAQTFRDNGECRLLGRDAVWLL